VAKPANEIKFVRQIKVSNMHYMPIEFETSWITTSSE